MGAFFIPKNKKAEAVGFGWIKLVFASADGFRLGIRMPFFFS